MKEIIASQVDGKNYKEVVASTKVAVVDFWADWCAPCRMMMPTLNKLANEMTHVTFLKANVEENGTLTSEMNLAGIPAIAIYVDGKLANILTGLQTENKLRDAINSVVD